MDTKVGKLAKRLYLEAHPDYTFKKKEIYANGQLCQANIWRDSQRPVLQEALAKLRCVA